MLYVLLLEEGQGPGYLFVNSIRAVPNETMQTVLSLSDQQLGIRKYFGKSRQVRVEGEPSEVRFSSLRLEAPHFTELKDWHDYGIVPDTEGREVSSFSVIFKRYGVDMSTLTFLNSFRNFNSKPTHMTPTESEEQQEDWHMPEAFLWHVLKSVSLAIAYLQRGYTPERGIDPDWDPIIHRDIHAANIFFDHDYLEDSKGFKFPRVILANFGRACRMSDPIWKPGMPGYCQEDATLREPWKDIVGMGDVLRHFIDIRAGKKAEIWEQQLEYVGLHYSPDLCDWFRELHWDWSENIDAAPAEDFPTVDTLIEELIPLAERNLAEIEAQGKTTYALGDRVSDPEELQIPRFITRGIDDFDYLDARRGARCRILGVRLEYTDLDSQPDWAPPRSPRPKPAPEPLSEGGKKSPKTGGNNGAPVGIKGGDTGAGGTNKGPGRVIKKGQKVQTPITQSGGRRRSYKCGICHQQGHNKQRCPQLSNA